MTRKREAMLSELLPYFIMSAQMDGLAAGETLIVGGKGLKFELSPFPKVLDFAFYKRLHRFCSMSFTGGLGPPETSGRTFQLWTVTA